MLGIIFFQMSVFFRSLEDVENQAERLINRAEQFPYVKNKYKYSLISGMRGQSKYVYSKLIRLLIYN